MTFRRKSNVSCGHSLLLWRRVAQTTVLVVACALFLVMLVNEKRMEENGVTWHSVAGKMIQDGKLATVVISRFMQFQPNLLFLGKARLLLFETFCLPTMVHQTNTNFVWLIRTDPQLHNSILEPLQLMLEPYPNFYLVLDNNNTIESSKGYRDHNVDDMSILTGSKALLRRHIELSRKRWMLEVAIDTDDGLHETYIERLQQRANTDIDKLMAKANVNATKDRIEYIYCIEKYLLWFSGTASNKVGYATKKKATTFNTPSGGIMREEVDPALCPDSGVGYLLSPGLGERVSIPPNGIPSTVRPCETVEDDLPATLTTSVKHYDETFQTTMRCLNWWDSTWHQAIQTRTVTSYGMDGFCQEWEESVNATYLRSIMAHAFHISPEQVEKSHSFVRAHQIDVMKDNIEGQCSRLQRRGQTCKENNATKTLIKYISQIEKQDDQILEDHKKKRLQRYRLGAHSTTNP